MVEPVVRCRHVILVSFQYFQCSVLSIRCELCGLQDPSRSVASLASSLRLSEVHGVCGLWGCLAAVLCDWGGFDRFHGMNGWECFSCKLSRHHRSQLLWPGSKGVGSLGDLAAQRKVKSMDLIYVSSWNKMPKSISEFVGRTSRLQTESLQYIVSGCRGTQ